jgi:hypothetical protein
MKLEYTIDICGNEILQDETGNHQVMMAWEKPYMEKCIEYLEPYGSVLEIGFGLGYSAAKLCSCENVREYTVIECCPEVWQRYEVFKTEMLANKRPELKINIIKGRWEDILSECGVFDSVFFDDYNGSVTHESQNRFNKFLYQLIVNRHTHIGTKICCYSTGHTEYTINGLDQLSYEYNIDVPNYCNYAKGNKMYIPVIIQTIDYHDTSNSNSNSILEELKDKLLYPQNEVTDVQRKFHEQVIKAKAYFDKPKSIYCNLMVIDNFYRNAKETREYILTQEFKVRGNYPGQRTTSMANQHLKEMIEGYIQHFAGKIVDWPMPNDGLGNDNTYNGSFQYTTSRDRTWIHNDGWNNWAGVLYLTPNAPVNSGTGIYRFKDGTRTVDEAEARGNKKLLDENSQDYTKWELVDKVGNVFNRLVLFNSKQYHASLDYFGTNKENGRLFQVFFFSTER